MKNKKQLLVIALTVGFASGCGISNDEKQERSISLKDSLVMNEQRIVSSIAAEQSKDTTRKFIRTADLKFKVKDVKTATFEIEDIVSAFNGFVTYTNLTSNVERRTIIPISADSSLETTYYTVENNMTIRVPNVKLDSTLRGMAKLIDYLDHRIIKADDVTLSLLEHKMSEKRLQKHTERLKNAIDNRGRKLNETSNTEEKLLNKETLSDDEKIAELRMKDDISLSTITLYVYQQKSIKAELIKNEKNIEYYKPSLLHRMNEALFNGWLVLEAILLFVMQTWSIILVGLIIFFVFRRYMQRKK